MRKLISLLFVLLMLCPCVLAETDSDMDFFLPFATPTSNHTSLSGISAVARGRTIVVRISDDWMAPLSMNPPFGFSSVTCANETEERIRLTYWFSDSERDSFLNLADAFGYNEETIRRPSISDVDNDLIVMNRRRMDDCWYLVIRPDKSFKNTYGVQMSFADVSAVWQFDQLTVSIEGETEPAAYQLNIQSANDSKAIFDKSGGRLRMVVFDELGANIAVIYKKNASSAEAKYAQLSIEGLDHIIELEGYKDGSRAVYCCVLSDNELRALESGASIALAHDK